jgi:hypothetical protein
MILKSFFVKISNNLLDYFLKEKYKYYIKIKERKCNGK